MPDFTLEIFTEEKSMENFLRELLPRILPVHLELDKNCFIRPHEGKDDLRKSLRRKVMAFPHFPKPIKLLVIHDQDSNDCGKLKEELVSICPDLKKEDFLIRIACKELENWYLGDLRSIELVYPDSKASQLINKSKFRNPDSLNGADEVLKLTSKFSKSHASRELGKIISLTENRSVSFNHLISGVSKFLGNNSIFTSG
jgi:hypothetical protein